eukprot:gnl/TRDRNA2_/TRDRNA2_160703_c0_seq2.p2 gnl/TRDRNA2_/TRDRNA2_160703_c0~~gnl/TRDRNA2_/TRDRNA2_160703_c0_seq2.p2  ORF type:complete len:145 (-),score=25.71 gnl/TRDRNA2_/TRDRNA2_160703_c0_seq2:52-486(-)
MTAVIRTLNAKLKIYEERLLQQAMTCAEELNDLKCHISTMPMSLPAKRLPGKEWEDDGLGACMRIGGDVDDRGLGMARAADGGMGQPASPASRCGGQSLIAASPGSRRRLPAGGAPAALGSGNVPGGSRAGSTAAASQVLPDAI